MGRKLWFFTGGAFAVGLAIVLLANFVPSFRDAAPLILLLVSGIWAAWVFWFCSVPRNFRLPMNWPRRQPAMGYPLPASYRWRLSLTQRMIAGNSHWGSARLMVRSSSQFPSSVRVRPPNSYQTFLRIPAPFSSQIFNNLLTAVFRAAPSKELSGHSDVAGLTV